jgi:hypothetical protein
MNLKGEKALNDRNRETIQLSEEELIKELGLNSKNIQQIQLFKKA